MQQEQNPPSRKIAHRIIYGLSGTGKTTLARLIILGLLTEDQGIAVWSGLDDRDWPRGVQYIEELDEFEELLADKNSPLWGYILVFDEAADLFEDTSVKTHPNLWRLLRKGRHAGHKIILITQYPTAIPRSIRSQCSEMDCFFMPDRIDAETATRGFGIGRTHSQDILQLQFFQYLKFRRPAISPVLKHLPALN